MTVTVTALAVVAQPAPVLDSDSDGVPNSTDRCADTPATHKVDSSGCTVYEETMAAVGDIDIEVRFPFDSAAVPASQRADVENLGAFMQRFPESTVMIEGHASNTGNPAYNMKLSERRANAVAEMLKTEFNIAASRITAIGYGVTRPRVEGNTPAAHAANQRIEAKVTAKIPAPDAVFLNDVTVDEHGVVYISDTRKNRVYKYANGVISIWLEDIIAANGLKSIGSDLYIAAADLLLKADKNGEITQSNKGFAQRADGLEPVGNGDFIVSCWAGIIYYVYADGRLEMLLDTQQQKLNTADIGWDADSKTLFVPTFSGSSVTAYRVSNIE